MCFEMVHAAEMPVDPGQHDQNHENNQHCQEDTFKARLFRAWACLLASHCRTHLRKLDYTGTEG
jgi:hypothetical protein